MADLHLYLWQDGKYCEFYFGAHNATEYRFHTDENGRGLYFFSYVTNQRLLIEGSGHFWLNENYRYCRAKILAYFKNGEGQYTQICLDGTA